MEVTLMQGISGSGKSTYARELSLKDKLGTEICSADDYFVGPDGVYNWSADKLGQAHNMCFAKYLTMFRQYGITQLVVDNTNLNPVDISPYIAVANAYSVPWKILQVGCEPERAFSRNQHGLTRSKVNQQYERMMAIVVPKHWWKNVFATGDLRYTSALARRNSEQAAKATSDQATDR